MIPFSEPERPSMIEWQKLKFDQEWRKGVLGDVSYLRCLFLIGYTPRDAQTELGLLRMEERRPDADLARLQRSREWLEDRR